LKQSHVGNGLYMQSLPGRYSQLLAQYAELMVLA
jgi:hypothetical protein